MFSFWEKGALVCLVKREREREMLMFISIDCRCAQCNELKWQSKWNDRKKLKMTHKFKWENQRARDLMAQSMMMMQQAGDWCSKCRFEILYFFLVFALMIMVIRLLCFSSFKLKHFYLRFFVHVWSVWIIKKWRWKLSPDYLSFFVFYCLKFLLFTFVELSAPDYDWWWKGGRGGGTDFQREL